MSYDRETLSILTDGARLKTSTLLLGESGKDDERYIEQFGYECWELDALDPSVISRLIDENVRMYRDEGLYRDVLMRENEEKGTLRDLRDGYQGLIQNWSEICENYDIYQ